MEHETLTSPVFVQNCTLYSASLFRRRIRIPA